MCGGWAPPPAGAFPPPPPRGCTPPAAPPPGSPPPRRGAPYVRRVGAATGGIFPDAPAAGLYALGVAALVLAARRRGRLQTGLLVAAGTGFGAAYLCREFIVFMYFAVPIFCRLLGLRLW